MGPFTPISDQTCIQYKLTTKSSLQFENAECDKLCVHEKFINEGLISEGAIEQVEIDIKYSGYINREKENADKLKRLEYVKIPTDIDYFKFSSLSNESKEKLNEVKPVNIGQAARISGIKPSDISILLIYLGR